MEAGIPRGRSGRRRSRRAREAEPAQEPNRPDASGFLIAIVTGTIRMTQEVEDRVDGEVPAQLAERGPQQDGPGDQEGDAVEHALHLVDQAVHLGWVTAENWVPKTPPAMKAAMKPDPPSPTAIPYASAALRRGSPAAMPLAIRLSVPRNG